MNAKTNNTKVLVSRDTKKVIENKILTFNTKYNDDINKLLNIINSINKNIKLDINCEYLNLDKLLVSYYVIFLIFARNILQESYQEYLLNNFYFYNHILNETLIKKYKKEVNAIENKFNLDLNKINLDF